MRVLFVQSTTLHVANSGPFLIPPAETYVEAHDSSDNDSTSSTMATENAGSDSSSASTDDEQGDALVQLTENSRMYQKMAFEVSFSVFKCRVHGSRPSRGLLACGLPVPVTQW